jgi:hypothetical protein
MEGSVRLGGATVASVEVLATQQIERPATPEHQDRASQQVHDDVPVDQRPDTSLEEDAFATSRSRFSATSAGRCP